MVSAISPYFTLWALVVVCREKSWRYAALADDLSSRIVQTLFAWFFIIVIAFRFIPASVVSRPVSAVWMPFVQEPWYRLPYKIRLAVGWLCLLAIVFGSAFGFPLQGVSLRFP